MLKRFFSLSILIFILGIAFIGVNAAEYPAQIPKVTYLSPYSYEGLAANEPFIISASCEYCHHVAVSIQKDNGPETYIAASYVEPSSSSYNYIYTYTPTSPGKYTINVRGRNTKSETAVGTKLAVGSNTVTVKNIASDDIYEPNGTDKNATLLNYNTTISAKISKPLDMDWYKFQIPVPGTINISANGMDILFNMFFRDASCKGLKSATNSGGSNCSISYKIATPGDYYLQTTGDYGQFSDTPYNLNISFTPDFSLNTNLNGGNVLSTDSVIDTIKINAVFPDGTSKDVTKLANFTTSDSSILYVRDGCLFSGSKTGAATVTATYEGKSVTTQAYKVLKLRKLICKQPSISFGILNFQGPTLIVDGYFADDSGIYAYEADQSFCVGYSSSDPSVAYVSNGTLYSGNCYGKANITITHPLGGQSITGTCHVTVGALSINISKPSQISTEKGPVSYTVNYSAANTINLSAEHVILNKTGTANGTVSVSGTGTANRVVTISNITGMGTLGISLTGGTASNNAETAPEVGPSETFSVVDTEPPTQPGSPIIKQVSETLVSLEWGPSTDNNGVFCYEVFRNHEKVIATIDTSAIDSRLNPGTTYKYYIVAVDASGNRSIPSSEVAATTSGTQAFTLKGCIKPDISSSNQQINEGFEIKIEGLQKSALTDKAGYFELRDIPQSSQGYLVKISKFGFLTREVKISGTEKEITLGSPDKSIDMWAGDLPISGVQDNAINMSDIVEMLNGFNSVLGDDKYKPVYDLDMDGAVNMSDMMIIIKHFNKTCENYDEI